MSVLRVGTAAMAVSPVARMMAVLDKFGKEPAQDRRRPTCKSVIALTAAAACLAVPAQGNEGRVEARGGIAWASGAEEAVAGIAAGYDFDVGEAAFFGVEGSADKILVDGSDVIWGATGRVGTKLGERGKLFAAAGYTFGDGEDVPHLGAGYQHRIGRSAYLKAEYRHFFSDFVDINTAVVGVGLVF